MGHDDGRRSIVPIAWVAAAAITLVISACGSDEGDLTTGANATTDTTPASTTAAALTGDEAACSVVEVWIDDVDALHEATPGGNGPTYSGPVDPESARAYYELTLHHLQALDQLELGELEEPIADVARLYATLDPQVEDMTDGQPPRAKPGTPTMERMEAVAGELGKATDGVWELVDSTCGLELPEL